VKEEATGTPGTGVCARCKKRKEVRPVTVSGHTKLLCAKCEDFEFNGGIDERKSAKEKPVQPE
jgi:hypothetical protein